MKSHGSFAGADGHWCDLEEDLRMYFPAEESLEKRRMEIVRIERTVAASRSRRVLSCIGGYILYYIYNSGQALEWNVDSRMNAKSQTIMFIQTG